MAITSIDGFIAASKQRLGFLKVANRTTANNAYFSVFDLTGSPDGGTLAVGNTANGVVHTDATTGYQPITDFGSGNLGYISSVEFSNTVASRIAMYDCLFSAGAYSFNSNVTLASQPSFTSRIPSGDYNGTEIWLEAVTAFTGTPTINVLYNNQAGAAKQTSATSLGSAPIVGRMYLLPLQAGDIGVSQINQVIATVASAGTFNIHVMRRLWSGRVRSTNDGNSNDMLLTGLPRVFQDSAIRFIVAADSTNTGNPEIYATIVNG
jgi:hypothetical protein